MNGVKLTKGQMVTDKEKDKQRDIRQKGLGKQIQIQ